MANWYQKIIGSLSGNVAEVDAANQIKITPTLVKADAGYVRLTDGNKEVAFSEDNRLRTAIDSIIFYDPVDGAVPDINRWNQSQATMTQAVANGFLVLNSAAVTTISTYSIITSVKRAPFLSEFPLYAHWRMKTPNVPQTNATMEAGLGLVATTVAPTDGAFFRWKVDGACYAVVVFNSSETPVSITAPSVNVTHSYEIVFKYDEVKFLIDEVEVASIANQVGQAAPTSTARLPFFLRVYTAGSAPALAPQLYVSEVMLAQLDVNWGKSWDQISAGMGRGVWQGQDPASLAALGQTSIWTNSGAPTARTPSNTAAAETALGGIIALGATATMAASTDYILCAYQVPVGLSLYIAGIDIGVMNSGAIGPATPTGLIVGLGLNASAVSLATVDGTQPLAAMTYGPRRIPLGIIPIVSAIPIGAVAAQALSVSFPNPQHHVDGGRFVHVIVRTPIAYVFVASQVLTFTVGFRGYFE